MNQPANTPTPAPTMPTAAPEVGKAVPANAMSDVPGFKAILIGDTGSGKTWAFRSAIKAGLSVRAILTEPHARLTLGDISCKDGMHWMYIPPSTGGWGEMMDRANLMTKMSWTAISKMTEDPKKSAYDSFWKLLHGLNAFKCDRCKQEFGDASTWGTDVLLGLDSLSGVNHAAMQMATGMSIARSQPQWGAAMSSELALIDKICMDVRCHFMLIAHADREANALTGASEITLLALGKANRGEFTKNFSDVIFAKRVMDKFMWSTLEPLVTGLKTTHLPLADKLEPNVGLLIDSWKKRGGIIEHTGESK